MATPNCFGPIAARALATKDTNRVLGQIAKALAYNSPWVNVLEGGVFPAGVSDTVRSVVQDQALPADSLVRPSFVTTATLCAPIDSQDDVATTEYTYSLGTKRGIGPKVCVKNGFAAYKGSYSMAEDSLKKLMVQYMNTDVRATLHDRSGTKAVAGLSSAYAFTQLFSGGEAQIDVPYPNIPAADIGQLTFSFLHAVARYKKDTVLDEMFSDGTIGAHYKFIGSVDIIEQFRQELGVKETLLSLTNGSFKSGERALTAYSWETFGNYRGISFGIDQRVLRASGLDINGQPIFVEPFIGVATTNGTAARVNPAWVAAPFEVGFLIGAGSFKRLVPERYVGEGSFKFAPQLTMGELQWHYELDNCENMYGDFGWHKYEITRAYQPLRPQAVTPILYQRCQQFSVTPCPVPVSGSNEGGSELI
jgi:hypothetical protein